ncbi:VanZ family protein [Pseudomarimonas salicorniae]|uniref:VanZ family protein n=1 Tax=Pseudomarimonas salicorniae TaxID=2933270 RepID=A0ABT0GHJ0_9GAMM|nr:VanZ family protein [Lysobacter sp. CAU 1642]MCK7594004.1 VanZ family protein [Lysobacter sp. CAU 1642]
MPFPPDQRSALARALLFSGLGVVALLLPLPPMPEWQSLINLAHVPLLAVLAWLWLDALASLGVPRLRAMIGVLLLGAAAGGAMELMQWFIPGRWPDPNDFLLNLVGLLLGLFAHWLYRRD